MAILIGPAGTSGLGYDAGLKKCKELGLNALEVEFTYGVRMKNEEAKKIGELAKELGICLSVHAPYYINLASFEKPKIQASIVRILQSCERAHYLGANCVVFHPGFYQKRTKEETYGIIKSHLIELNNKISENKFKIELCLETTGKSSAFGNLDELLRLNEEIKTSFCIDFAHLRARNNGNIDYGEIFGKLKQFNFIHSHFSGIEWTEKGEKRHIITKEKDIEELAQHILKNKMNITIINESPDPFGDAVKTKEVFERRIKHKL